MHKSNALIEFLEFLLDRYPDIVRAAGTHLIISVVSVLLGIVVAVPLGIYLTRNRRRWINSGIFGIANIFQTIPSLALLAILIPLFGIGMKPAIIALFLYSLLPILRNTYAGFQSVDPAVLEAARGMGYSSAQRLLRVQFPLAFPFIMSGIRVTAVYIISWTTLAALIGAGGLGQLIVAGLGVNKEELIVTGAFSAILFALLADWMLGIVERCFTGKTKSSAESSLLQG